MFLTQITQLLLIGILIQFNFRIDLEILQGERGDFFFSAKTPLLLNTNYNASG